jgi:hypothetical protein
MLSTMLVMFGAIVILSGITIAVKRKQRIQTLSIKELERKERERILLNLKETWSKNANNKIPVKFPEGHWSENDKKLFANTWKRMNDKVLH